jgi:hypothetical protein
MFRYAQYLRTIRSLEQKIRADEEETDRATEAARRRGSSQETIDEIMGGSDASELRYKLRRAMSEYYISKSYRLVIPLPDPSDQTTWGTFDDGHTVDCVLTSAGVNQVRSAIRAERKARFEMILMWVPGIIGIMGAAIGLAAVFAGKGH